MPIESQFGGFYGTDAANPATLSATFAALFPPGAVAAELRAPGSASLLWPAELGYVANAVPKRVQEFAAGRLCARRALAEFGVHYFPLRVARDRQPVWPEFLVGSITHTAGICAAVVGERSRFIALGVDSEIADAVKTELWPSICITEELAWLESLPAGERAAGATLIFSAKEAFYKCQYPVTGEHLSFSALRVTPSDWGGSVGSFAVSPTRPMAVFDRSAPSASPSGPPPLRGAYRFHEEFVSAGIALPAAQAARSAPHGPAESAAPYPGEERGLSRPCRPETA